MLRQNVRDHFSKIYLFCEIIFNFLFFFWQTMIKHTIDIFCIVRKNVRKLKMMFIDNEFRIDINWKFIFAVDANDSNDRKLKIDRFETFYRLSMKNRHIISNNCFCSKWYISFHFYVCWMIFENIRRFEIVIETECVNRIRSMWISICSCVENSNNFEKIKLYDRYRIINSSKMKFVCTLWKN